MHGDLRLSSTPELWVGARLKDLAGTTASRLRLWLTSGRVQSPSGAFCAWRDAASDDLAFEYPEITGYALTWLAARIREDDRALASGTRAAEWVVRRLAAGDRSARACWEDGAVYTFDLGMIASGLISFGSAAGNVGYERVGRMVAASLAAYVDHEGELPALAPDGPSGARDGQWSSGGRVHLVKCVQALLLGDHPNQARRLVGQASADQAADGHFITQPGDSFVMLHPHLYAVEGLWMWAMSSGDVHALTRARAAVDWAWRQQLPDGGLPRWVSATETGPEQLDATAQAIRAALLLGCIPDGLERAVARLAACAATDGAYGSALVYRPHDLAQHLNSWVTMFGEQALRLASGEVDGLDWRELV
jgi:hypothetical protein